MIDLVAKGLAALPAIPRLTCYKYPPGNRP